MIATMAANATEILGKPDRGALLRRLHADRAESEEERAKAFEDAGGGCQATYFNQARRPPGAALRPRRAG
jgi:hypothetical protein